MALTVDGWELVAGESQYPPGGSGQHTNGPATWWARKHQGDEHLCHDIKYLAEMVAGQEFAGIIGGPPCQSMTKLKAIRAPKYPDLTPYVREVLGACEWSFYLFENVARLDLEGASHVRLNAMHFYQPHQSRARWFTFRGIEAPKPEYRGSVDDLMAYSVVAGRIYGPKRGARLQGYPAAADLPFPCVQLQKGLANAVPYPLAKAWAESAMARSEP